MTDNLKISLVQKDLVWEDPKANRDKIDGLLSNIGNTDLIILPEMFTTGFTMDSEKFAEEMNGATEKWMVQRAKELNTAICGSLIIKDGEFFNRMLFVFPDGTVEHYDKRHLFRMAGETDYFSPGKEKKIVHYKGWNICLQVCYDLRFPVFSKNVFKDGEWEYDLLIYVANWPSPRANAWRTLSEARAHENQSYVAAVNRVGSDDAGHEYDGDSAIISPKGLRLLEFAKGEESVKGVSISYSELKTFRKKFPLGMDTDNFSIQI